MSAGRSRHFLLSREIVNGNMNSMAESRFISMLTFLTIQIHSIYSLVESVVDQANHVAAVPRDFLLETTWSAETSLRVQLKYRGRDTRSVAVEFIALRHPMINL